jgi:hypothetical protein
MRVITPPRLPHPARREQEALYVQDVLQLREGALLRGNEYEDKYVGIGTRQ